MRVVHTEARVLERVIEVGDRAVVIRGPSGSGLGLKECDSVTVSRNQIRDNRVGLFIDQSPIDPNNTNQFLRYPLALEKGECQDGLTFLSPLFLSPSQSYGIHSNHLTPRIQS